ncbi:hypothetical protein P4O66_004732 [Electrophorus voltai]|uniref:EF-hand domain-containing protein n=1 Tax=Electrophorus voltai TaxID=2609070 RepID=A0AAD9E1K8_9TELE|nr:hypothetical protein P4O66_004732 [Electrophorus voltai]
MSSTDTIPLQCPAQTPYRSSVQYRQHTAPMSSTDSIPLQCPVQTAYRSNVQYRQHTAPVSSTDTIPLQCPAQTPYRSSVQYRHHTAPVSSTDTIPLQCPAQNMPYADFVSAPAWLCPSEGRTELARYQTVTTSTHRVKQKGWSVSHGSRALPAVEPPVIPTREATHGDGEREERGSEGRTLMTLTLTFTPCTQLNMASVGRALAASGEEEKQPSPHTDESPAPAPPPQPVLEGSELGHCRARAAMCLNPIGWYSKPHSVWSPAIDKSGAFTIMDQNRDGFIDENDLRDTFAAVGRLNVKQEAIDEMLKEPQDPLTLLSFSPCLGRSSKMEQMFTAFPPDVAGNLDYKNLVYIITHGEEKDQK